MRLLTIFFLFSFISSFAQSPRKDKPVVKMITRNVTQDIISLIPQGTIIVDIMDQVVVSPRMQELQSRFMQAIQKNQQWFLEQRKIIESTGKELAYDARVGMTKSEWEEYKILSDSQSGMQIVASGRSKVMINRNDDIISFKADGKLAFLNSVTIDSKKNIVKIQDHILMPVDTINVNNANNAFKTKWRGYKWEFSDPANFSPPNSAKELANFTVKLYQFTLGLFEKSGKTLIEISGKEMKSGIQTVNYQIPIVF